MYTQQHHGISVTYQHQDKSYVGYLSLPNDAASPRPGVLICPEFWGITNYIKWRADRYADLGYAALVVDFYGDGYLATTAEDATEKSNMIKENLDQAIGIFKSAMDIFNRESTVDQNRVAAVGYCFGGAMALSMANAGFPLRAVMAFHSQVELPIMPSEKLTANVVVANGADDPFVKPETISTWKEQMNAIDASYEYISYEGVKHAYTNKGANEKGKKFDLPLDYDAQADAHSWQRVQDLLKEVF
ncbi:dienelactone hydrolase family protein [Nonlabens xiamenensis]|uniref:dienelactone hydrolase family protein n=1 Tax=Nonlabens xiamenensis TaxID=2341043 RepID=UPI0013DE59B6|nr:dienelactone hydrolase family protein [Nonlabens xiamenensis]